MVKRYLFSLLTSLFFANAIAQTITIGNGTFSGTSAPVASWYNSSATESIYTASEIGTSGNITRIAYDKASGSSTVDLNVRIYMKTTAADYLENTYAVGNDFNDYTLVYDGVMPNHSTSGWMEVLLQTPFSYTDTSQNISVLIVGETCISSGRPQYRYTSTSGVRMSALYTDGGIGCTANNPWVATSSMAAKLERPNIRLTLETLSNNKYKWSEGDVIITKNNDSFTLTSSSSVVNKIEVFSLTGQLLYSNDAVKSNRFLIDGIQQTNNILIVRLTNEDNLSMIKKLIF